jgi:hypothetical protein
MEKLMSYLDNLLEPGETIRVRGRYHWLSNVRSVFLLNMFSEVAVTDRRVLSKFGILAAHCQSIGLSQIESTDVSQSLLGRVMGYGTLHIWGAGGKALCLSGLSRPRQLARALGGHVTPEQATRVAPRTARQKRV